MPTAHRHVRRGAFRRLAASTARRPSSMGEADEPLELIDNNLLELLAWEGRSR